MRIVQTIAALAACAIVAACAHTIQDTSGRAYLSNGPELDADVTRSGAARTDQSGRAEFRQRLRDAADVEPRLRFPARIGIARIERGTLSAVPPEEAEAWLKTATKLARVGEFVPVSPLIAEIVASEQNDDRSRRSSYDTRLADTVRKLRLGAARQHLDAVLIYEVAGTANDNATPLSMADLSIVGMFIVPSRHLKAEGFASALLLDVRNGYPYGTATAKADDANLVPNIGSDARTGDLLRRAHTAAVTKLTAEVEAMANELYARRLQAR